jgi:hypothetical protein
MTDKMPIVVIVGDGGRSKRRRQGKWSSPERCRIPRSESPTRAWKTVAPVAVVLALLPVPAGLPHHDWCLFSIFVGVVEWLWRAECGNGGVHPGAAGGALWELM